MNSDGKDYLRAHIKAGIELAKTVEGFKDVIEKLEAQLKLKDKCLEISREINKNLMFHFQDYGLEEESFVLLMEVEKAREAESKINEMLKGGEDG